MGSTTGAGLVSNAAVVGAKYIRPPLGECIPRGTYSVGSTEQTPKWIADVPLHEVRGGEFQLGQHPVTNAEWRCFMEAGGYEDVHLWKSPAAKLWRSGEITYACWEFWWTYYREWMKRKGRLIELLGEAGELSIAEVASMIRRRDETPKEFKNFLEVERLGEQMRSGRFNKPAGLIVDSDNPLQPVSGICWFEVQAYCVWLSEQSGEKWRLPTEAEWEVGARYGAPGHENYPWGNTFDQQRCNTVMSGIYGPTPIGMFPKGVTASSLYDMSGNVAEWTSSRYDKPYGDQDEKQTKPSKFALRVLRGGSWYYGKEYARLTFRLQYHPGFRARTAGFRVLRDWA